MNFSSLSIMTNAFSGTAGGFVAKSGAKPDTVTPKGGYSRNPSQDAD